MCLYINISVYFWCMQEYWPLNFSTSAAHSLVLCSTHFHEMHTVKADVMLFHINEKMKPKNTNLEAFWFLTQEET